LLIASKVLLLLLLLLLLLRTDKNPKFNKLHQKRRWKNLTKISQIGLGEAQQLSWRCATPTPASSTSTLSLLASLQWKPAV
jgi:hypothetical protein